MSMWNLAVVTFAFCFAVRSAIGYENAYDLLERRQQRYYEPRYIPSTFYNRNRFIRPYSVYPTVNPYYSNVRNGYDNLGNGVPFGRFHQYQQSVGGLRHDRRPFRLFGNVEFQTRPPLIKPQYGYVSQVSSPVPVVPLHEGEYQLFKRIPEHKDYNRLIEDKEGNKQREMDEFYLKTHGGVSSDSWNRENVGEQLLSDQAGENKLSLRSNRVTKKGRTTKGFAVHHHKDETGNSTTFFDENTDFGGQSDLRDLSDGFDSRRTLEQISHKGDDKYLKEVDSQTGNYGNGLLKENERFEKDFSSGLGLAETKNKFRIGNGNDDLTLPKTYRYLNGEPFDDILPVADTYY